MRVVPVEVKWKSELAWGWFYLNRAEKRELTHQKDQGKTARN